MLDKIEVDNSIFFFDCLMMNLVQICLSVFLAYLLTYSITRDFFHQTMCFSNLLIKNYKNKSFYLMYHVASQYFTLQLILIFMSFFLLFIADFFDDAKIVFFRLYIFNKFIISIRIYT